MSDHLPLLDDLVVLLAAAVPIALICNRLRLPAIVGFMATGLLIGPSALGLISGIAAVEAMAEIGVALLLFVIGLEFSLRRILEMRRLLFLGGGLQVLVTASLAFGIALLAGASTGQAVFLGFLLALSSTAIVLKSYVDRGEMDTPHGKIGLAILLFQDLCIVPMMLLLPILGGAGGYSAVSVLLRLAGAAVAIALIMLTARIVVPRALHQIVRLRSREVFIIFIVLASLGTAWITSKFGLSMALGAFIAGLVLSESEYSHQIVADILPLRDAFNSLFFISIGMLASLSLIGNNLPLLLGWTAALIACKALVVLVVARLMGNSLRVATITAVGLAQIGEFSFILAKAGAGQGLLPGESFQLFLAVSIISMVATPFLIQAAPRIGYAVQSLLSPESLLEPSMAGLGYGAQNLKGHVVVAGYGLNGRNLSSVLRRVGVPYVVLELNPEAVREAKARGEPIQYGDCTRTEVLQTTNIDHARVFVLAISDPIATRRAVQIARQRNRHLHIIVRTRYMSELQDLYHLGADQVIPEEFETSIEIFSRVLQEYGLARNVIRREVEGIRREGYMMLRASSLPLIEMSNIADALKTASTETLYIDQGSAGAGRTLGELDLRRKTGATVIAVTRQDNMEVTPGPDFKLESEDILVLLGSPESIDSAIEYLSGTDSQ